MADMKPDPKDWVGMDHDEIKKTFKAAIEKEATHVIQTAIAGNDVSELIKAAFQKKWLNDKDTWLEDGVRNALQAALYESVEKAIEDAGLQAMIDKTIQDYIATDEFKELLKKRAIDAVNATTFRFSPED